VGAAEKSAREERREKSARPAFIMAQKRAVSRGSVSPIGARRASPIRAGKRASLGAALGEQLGATEQSEEKRRPEMSK